VISSFGRTDELPLNRLATIQDEFSHRGNRRLAPRRKELRSRVSKATKGGTGVDARAEPAKSDLPAFKTCVRIKSKKDFSVRLAASGANSLIAGITDGALVDR